MNIFACGIQNKTFIKIYSAHKKLHVAIQSGKKTKKYTT